MLNQFTRILSITAFLFFMSQLAFAETPCAAQMGSCMYYQCLTESYQCEGGNYFRQFGRPYCQKFSEEASTYTEIGQGFIAHVRQCLQEKMERDAQWLNCHTARKLALQHHVECYLEAGYCHLPMVDKQNIANTAYKEFFWPDFAATGVRLNASCLWY